MIWPIFWPDDVQFTHPANTRQPSEDFDADGKYIGTLALYGFAARNGRRLADNAPEAMLSLVTNTAIPSGLKPSISQQLRDTSFPYVVPVSKAR
jgi:hypothetical protein